MKFNIGDKVSFLNASGSAVVVNILSNFRVLVLNEDGFEVPVSINEIVPLSDQSQYATDAKKHRRWTDEKEDIEVSPPKLQYDEAWEVDLHLYDDTDVGRFRSDHDKFLYQIKYFKRCMDAAIAHRVKKIIFIHGVGKLTLKKEILHLLKSYDRVRHYDAPFKKYGFGALVVETG